MIHVLLSFDPATTTEALTDFEIITARSRPTALVQLDLVLQHWYS